MSHRRMCGVVLWSNPDDQKAVVWCEDQGNLAYYVEPRDNELTGVMLDAGDLIEFELCEDRQIRRVTNPVLLIQDHAPELARRLDVCANSQSHDRSNDSPVAQGEAVSNVVPFPGPQTWDMPSSKHVTA